ncbi:MAG: hypothetical protein ABL989_07750, partial [Gammaproteobacteria bacterium]
MKHPGPLGLIASVFALAWLAPATASIVNGSFESGTLLGWESLGDVSLQTSSIGISPTDGSSQALITTLCGDGTSIPGPIGCQITNVERPYSGTNALYTEFYCQDFDPDCIRPPIGTPGWEVFDFVGLTPADLLTDPDPPGANGEGSAIRQSFVANAGETVSVDYNYVGEYEWGFLTLLAIDPGSTLRIIERAPRQTLLSNMRLCERVEGELVGSDICDYPNQETVETGYRHFAFQIPDAGTYQIGFAVFEIEEGTVPSAMLIDNVTLTPVPAPPAIW